MKVGKANVEILARSGTSAVVHYLHGICGSIYHLHLSRDLPRSKKTQKGNKKYLEGCMMYECKYCGGWFFLEEGYEPETDVIVCPCCGETFEEN